MQVTIKIPDEVVQQARARGVPISTYVEELLANQTDNYEKQLTLKTADEIRDWLESLARLSEKIPPLPSTISRDWIYQDHD